jgi:hypothetical protein
MPKYRFAYDVGYRKPKSLGTLVFSDDASAIDAFTRLDMEGIAAELWRPDQKRLLARRDADGAVSVDEARRLKRNHRRSSGFCYLQSERRFIAAPENGLATAFRSSHGQGKG